MKRFAALSTLLLCSSISHAQDASSVSPKRDAPTASTEDARLKALEEQVRNLAGEVALLRSELKELRDTKSPEQPSGPQVLLASAHPEPGMLPASPTPAAPQAVQTQTFGGASGNAKLLNPDISLIGDFIGTAGHNNVAPGRSLEMHESEVGFQAIIDPYARADAFLSFGETGVNVEEAYVTFTSLPGGLLLKVGKKRADFGKVNTIHNHALPFIDRPLVTNNLVGGEDGIDDAGFFLSRFLPAPKNWFLEGSAEVLRGDSADVFQASRRPTSISASPMPAVTTMLASARPSILLDFSPICIAETRRSAGSRSAALSTNPSCSVPSCSGARVTSALSTNPSCSVPSCSGARVTSSLPQSRIFSRRNMLLACTPPRNTA